MDDHEQRENALASLAQFRALSALSKDPEADAIAQELEEQRRSKARNKLIGAGKVRARVNFCFDLRAANETRVTLRRG